MCWNYSVFLKNNNHEFKTYCILDGILLKFWNDDILNDTFFNIKKVIYWIDLGWPSLIKETRGSSNKPCYFYKNQIETNWKTQSQLTQH
jgi:hypothetical protein